MIASLSLFEKEHAAREKYVYFVCGLAGALFAYIGKDYYPEHPIKIIAVLTISALISLTLCVAFGMARIQVYTHGLSINRDVLVAEEKLENIRGCKVKQMAKESNYAMDYKTGKEYTSIEELDKDINILQETRDKDFIRMEKWFKGATCLLFICNIFLALGFILLICAKLAG